MYRLCIVGCRSARTSSSSGWIRYHAPAEGGTAGADAAAHNRKHVASKRALDKAKLMLAVSWLVSPMNDCNTAFLGSACPRDTKLAMHQHLRLQIHAHPLLLKQVRLSLPHAHILWVCIISTTKALHVCYISRCVN